MRKALLILGILSLIIGSVSAWRTVHFIQRAIKVEAKVLGFSSIQKLERIAGDCSAYRKSCAAKVSFILPSGENIETLIPQPLFARVPADKIGLFVDVANPTEPQIASLHVLFRNSSSTLFLGIICLFLSWIIGPTKRSNQND